MSFNQKDVRILKLHEKGMSEAQIAKKIGYGFNIQEGVQRVRDALERAKQLNKTPAYET